jgi:hypothetical protein
VVSYPDLPTLIEMVCYPFSSCLDEEQPYALEHYQAGREHKADVGQSEV